MSSAGAVDIDANVLVSICAKEPGCQTAEDALDDYAAKNWTFYAPGTILTEVLFILCRKRPTAVLETAAGVLAGSARRLPETIERQAYVHNDLAH